MKLSDIFSTSSKKINQSKETIKAEPSSSGKVSRQIKALAPGRQLQGEIVERNGSEVRIKLSDDVVLTAKLDRDVNVQEGQMLTFEVKNNGSALTLSPLFTNTAVADNVFKALQMAGLPINETTVAMTESMMQQGMSVDSKSLQNIFREVMANPKAPVESIVQLHRMGMEVNEANLNQMESYKALTHQLVSGMTDVLSKLPEAFREISMAFGEKEAIRVFQEILQKLFPDMQETETEGMPDASLKPGENPDGQTTLPVTETLTETDDVWTKGSQTGLPVDGALELLQEETGDIPGLEPLSAQEKVNFVKLLSAIPKESYPEIEKLVQEIRQGTAEPEKILKQLSQIPIKGGAELQIALADILKSGEYQKLLEASVLKQWTLKPEQVVENREVKEVYEKLVKQLEGVRQALQDGGVPSAAAAKSAVNLSQNIDFINQMNQMYTYVQLPLKMNSGNANGELYVYTNKRSLAEKDGAVSALLHLDMENLGPVDVYIAMQQEKVNTRFTVRDDEMIDFINEHIHILNDRLQKKGYSMKCEMSVREEKEGEESPIENILQTEKNTSMLAQYAFDVRA